MAASQDRNFRVKGESPEWDSYKVKGSTTIYLGTMVAIGTDGYAIPAADAASLKVVGVAQDHIANTGGDGAKRVRAAKCVATMANSVSNAATIVQLGGTVYVEDDQTINKDGGSHTVAAGKLVQLDDDGTCWVQFA